MDVFERRSTERFESEVGRIERISNRIVEIQFADGLELGRREAEASQHCIRTLTGGAPAALLIDCRSAYALTFGAQQVVAADDGLIAVAHLVTGTAGHILTDYARSTYFKHVPVRSFADRAHAVAWLEDAAHAEEAVRPEVAAPFGALPAAGRG